jgi:hypothetical protein
MNVEITLRDEKYVRILTTLQNQINASPHLREHFNKLVIIRSEQEMVGFRIDLVRVLHATPLPTPAGT